MRIRVYFNFTIEACGMCIFPCRLCTLAARPMCVSLADYARLQLDHYAFDVQITHDCKTTNVRFPSGLQYCSTPNVRFSCRLRRVAARLCCSLLYLRSSPRRNGERVGGGVVVVVNHWASININCYFLRVSSPSLWFFFFFFFFFCFQSRLRV